MSETTWVVPGIHGEWTVRPRPSPSGVSEGSVLVRRSAGQSLLSVASATVLRKSSAMLNCGLINKFQVNGVG